jgi:hypothetical protein
VALQRLAQVVGREEAGVGEAPVAVAFVDEVVVVVAEGAFEVETPAAGLGARDGREAGQVFVVADCGCWEGVVSI